MTKLTGILYYEALMSWRRRGLTILVFAFTVALLLLLYAAQRIENAPPGIATDFIRALSFGIFPSLWLLISGVPLVAAETFPYDHRTQTKELLGGLPIPAASYLIGKVLGVCLLLLILFAGSSIIIGAAGFLLYGAYDLRAYLLFWLYTLLPMSLFAAAVGTLIAVGCTTRRQAVVVGFFCIPYAVSISIYGLVAEGFSPANIFQTILFLLANAAVIWLLAWLWLRNREGI